MNIEVIQMAANYVRPIINETMGKSWVMNGEDNAMYKDLINAYYGSTTNSAIINSYSNFIFGKGLNIDQNFISKKELKKVCFDYVLFEEATIEVLPDGTLKHADKSKILPSKSIDGVVKSYWYSFDWSDLRKYPPKEIDAYGYGAKNKSKIYLISDYKVGQFYFNNPSYLAAMPYCEVEIELGNYYVNHIKNGLSFGHIINVNGGKPEDEDQLKEHTRKIKSQLTGSNNSGKFLLSFNNSKDEETTVTALEVSDAHEQYQFITAEAQNKICIAHKAIKSIIGIETTTGFSSNAEEIETAFNETYINVIQPKQETILDAIEEIKGLKNLDFIPLREFSKVENVQMKKVVTLDDFGEDIDLEKWELLDSSKVDYDNEQDAQKLLNDLNDEYSLQLVGKVALASISTGTARPNSKSEQDGKLFKSRYRYSGNENPERDFCKTMMSKNKLYRKEDIDRMSKENVNPGFGMSPNPNQPYDIWLWKGGGLLSDKYNHGTCKHYWTRETYILKADVNNPLAEKFTAAQARKAGEILPTNDKRGYEAPHDM